VECWNFFPANGAFNGRNKFNTNTASPTHAHRLLAYSIPLVGDLNGDLKPEIVAIGLTAVYSDVTASAQYITVMDGQTGKRLVEFDTQCEFAVSSSQPDVSAYHSSPSYMAIADVDNDGKGEIIMAFPKARNAGGTANNAEHSEQLFAYKVVTNSANVITGLQLFWKAPVEYKSPLTGTNHRVYDVPAPYIADLNGDGIPEVIVYNKIYNAQTGRLLMAWDGPAGTAKNSSLASGTGLYAYENSGIYTDLAISNNVYNRAFTGRRPSTDDSDWKDDYLAVFAVENMDADDNLEVIAGNRIYKFQFNYLGRDGEAGSHVNNTYTTIEGPRSVTIPTGTSTSITYYLSDGFTRVADIDGDGYIDVINVSEITATGSYGSRAGILITVWDPRYASTIKAASAFYGNGGVVEHIPTFGVPFIGDINGKVDGGWNGTTFTKKLPEIGFITGDLYINSSTATPKRNGLTFHALSDVNLRKGMDWDNNNTTNATRHFNRNDVTGRYGHIFAVTYCDNDQSGAVPFDKRLKLSWAMEHSDRSANTGLTIFDFNNDGAKDLVYRDEKTLRVVSPKYGERDYVDLSETTGPGTSVLFRTNAYSFTGFEAAIVADVNMDASADIIVTNTPTTGNNLDGWVSVFEYSGTKWAPAPPVWNQAYYNPTQVRENLTIPARPQSIMSTYTLDAETLTPYNGAWIQQPIVKEGEDYKPVIRLPDALLTKMVVSSGNPTEVTLTIYNRGTASINATTPIAFRDGGTTGLPLASSALITTREVGIDIFPNEKVTRTYTLTGNYSNKLIWARITDNGSAFPATGYNDCKTDDLSNEISGSDCVPEYVITVVPDTVLCGNSGGAPATLTATLSGASHPGALSYQWYRNETLIAGATYDTCLTLLPGQYTCFVTEGVCRDYTPARTLTVQYMEARDDYAGVFGGIQSYIDVLKNDVVPGACIPEIIVTEGPIHGNWGTVNNGVLYLLDPVFTSGIDTLVYQLADGVTANIYITVSEDPDNVVDTPVCRVSPGMPDWSVVEEWKSTYGKVESARPWYMGDLDNDDLPEIVSLSLESKQTVIGVPDFFGKIVIFPGHDRDNPVFINTTTLFGGGDYYLSAYGIAKVNGEGLIVVVGCDGYLYAYSYPAGTQKWKSDLQACWNTDVREGAPTVSFADFNNDGTPEIYIGNRLFNAVNGHLLCDGGTNNKGFSIHNNTNGYGGSLPVAVDIDDDKKLELVAGNQVYKVNKVAGAWTMTVYKTITPPVLSNGVQVIADGHVSVANLNNGSGDHHPDAVISLVQNNAGTYYSVLYGWDIDGDALLFREHVEGASKGIPAIGDINGDGEVEIVMLFDDSLKAYKLPTVFGPAAGLTPLWSLAVDESEGRTGCTLFDFDQDGTAEIVYRDQSKVRVLDGRQDPPVPLMTIPSVSATMWEYPVIADVNGDRMAELVVAGGTAPDASFMSVYRPDYASGASPWAPARRVWNQYAYNAVNVNEDLTIPAKQANPAVAYPGTDGIINNDDVYPFNAFLQQQTIIDKRGLPVWLAMNVEVAGEIEEFYDAAGDSLTLTLTIYNAGDAPIRPPFYVSAYNNTVLPANVMITDSIMTLVHPGESEFLRIIIRNISDFMPVDSIHVRLNDNGSGQFLQSECAYSSNVIVLNLSEMVIAANDYVNAITFMPVLVDVLANDSLPDACTDPIIEIKEYSSGHGTVSIVNGKIQYTAHAGFHGADTIIYRVICGDENALAAVYVLVHNPPDNIIDPGTCIAPTDNDSFSIRKQQQSADSLSHPGAVTLVGDLDGDGIPEIVTMTSSNKILDRHDRISVLDGGTLQLRTSISLSPYIDGATAGGWLSPAPMLLVDADRNGLGEIIYAHNNAVHAYEADTTGGVFQMTHKWSSTSYTRPAAGVMGDGALPHLVVTDFNGDGVPELVVFNKILNATTGAVMGETEDIATAFVGRNSNTSHPNQATNFLATADMTGDGFPGIVAGAAVYKVTVSSDGTTAACSTLSKNTTIGDGFSTVADIDMDGRPEVIIVKMISAVQSVVYLWWPDIEGGGEGTYTASDPLLLSLDNQHSFPAVGDIDGLTDPQTGKKYPEICVRAQNFIFTLKYDPTATRPLTKWTANSGGSSGGTGLSLFDFNNDGIQELVYRDKTKLHVLDGRGTTAIMLGETDCASDLSWEYPVVADTDGDGSANICVPCGYRVAVFESAGKPWPSARPVWNQMPYEALKIDETLTVSRYPVPKNMSFDGRYPYHGSLLQVPVFDISDFSVVQPIANPAVHSVWTTQVNQATVRVWVRIQNLGEKNTPAGLPVALYGKVSAVATPELLQVKPVGAVIVPTGCYDMYFDVPAESIYPELLARVQDDGVSYPADGPFLDCDTDNNTGSCTVAQAIDDAYNISSSPASFNVLDNDFLGDCPTGTLSGFGIVEGIGMNHGTASITIDSLISYEFENDSTPFIDSLVYYIRCNGDSSAATIYILSHKPMSLSYIACPGSLVTIGFAPIADVQYNWYDTVIAGIPDTSNANPYVVTKDSINPVQSLWAEPIYRGMVFPRIRVDLSMPADCGGNTVPFSGCATTGVLLFKEDFGGNDPGDPRVSPTGRPSEVASIYTYVTTLQTVKQYTISKTTTSFSAYTGWYKGLSDHTTPGDTTTGYFMAFDADAVAGQIYTCSITGLCPGLKLSFSAWVTSFHTNAALPDKTNLMFELVDKSGGVLTQYYTGNIPDADPNWKQYGFEFVVPTKDTSLTLRIINNSTGSNGCDFMIDDIEIRFCAPSINVTSDEEIVCVGDTLRLSGEYTDDGTFGVIVQTMWLYSTTGDISNLSDWTYIESDMTTNGTITHEYVVPNVTTAQAGYYRMMASNFSSIYKPNCCATSRVIHVTVETPPPAPVIYPVSNTCAGGELLFSVPAISAAYEWRTDNSSGAYAGALPYVIATTVGTHTYVARVQSEQGCWSPYSAPVAGEITAATATPSITITALSANSSAATPTVTFVVAWPDNTHDCRHLSDVWLFVDHRATINNVVGPWTRATLAGSPTIDAASVGGGTIETVAGNLNGFWLHGIDGAYSATITVPVTVAAPTFSWCAYASNYPPNATPDGNDLYHLHGTAPFVINGVSQGAATTYSGCINSLTDATGCPGLVPPQPVIISATADPTIIVLSGNGSSMLRVEASNAVEYSFDNGTTWSPYGYLLVSPPATREYYIVAKSRGGCVSNTETVPVIVIP
jgi:hypothetical protein